MKSPRVSIWKLSDAPQALQLLYNGLGTPAWVTLVPRELKGRDLDEVLSGSVRYDVPNGDVVYFGGTDAGQPSAEVVRPKSARLGSR